ncbi:hypothetical protein HPB52_012904 [Rhipicephalus sanguineus]|uniref:RING-type domain-containing protein n=1 Tax=Rhipicephalus sanguineus TaxID=34632 RepID=A0A9D4QDG4_RHISA|nr:hypothetical protein HPB52_012904 [Rhipicephalus sanguineus]
MTDLRRGTGSSWKYTLTGFGEFLEMRRVTFAEPMPAARLCGFCGLLPCRTALLPCGHVFCESCKAQLLCGKHFYCPFDDEKFTDSDVHQMTTEWCELEQRRIVCSVGSQACGFSGKLSELANHLTRCGGGKVKCCKCRRPVSRNLAVDHFRSCTRGPLYTSNDEGASKGFAAKVADGERSLRELIPSEGVDLEAVRTGRCSNSLADRVASLERQYLELQKLCSSNEQHSVADAKKESVIQGPLRAAPKAGVLITTCKFADISAGVDSLNEEVTELRKSADTYTLGGYTFKLECEFSNGEGDISVNFGISLRDGEWDSYVDWPFEKQVTLLIMHPRDPAKDIPLPVSMVDDDAVKKPNVDTCNCVTWTDWNSWEDIELQGYVDRGALYVNVEFA